MRAIYRLHAGASAPEWRAPNTSASVKKLTRQIIADLAPQRAGHRHLRGNELTSRGLKCRLGTRLAESHRV